MQRKRPKTFKKPVKKEIKPLIESEDIKTKITKVRIIGIGGGGGTIVSEIAYKMPRASFVVANTDAQALKTASQKSSRFHFGQSLTRGLGTGMNPELGMQAALIEKDKIKKLLEGQDLCIFVACLGGGTGSGAVPIFAKIAKSLGNLTYGIFTLPFKFEGERKMEIARESLKKVKNHLNALSVIPNERAFQLIDKSTPLRQALSTVNKALTESLTGLIETIYEPGLINIDFADFRTILEGKGRLAYLNTAEVEIKKDSAKNLIVKALNSPLYPYGIKGAKGVLFNIAGEKELSLAEVNEISKTISELVNPEAKIIFGISQGKKYSGILKTTLLVTGCSMKIFSSEDKGKAPKKIKKPPVFRVKETAPEKPKEQQNKKSGANKKTNKKARPKKKKTIKKAKEEIVQESLPEKNLNLFEAIADERVRKNALQVKRDVEETEAEMLAKERIWETPTFLRRKMEK
ncbi:MAG: cell division protein FtsZ [Candidatus Nealsonbacteria bacterium]|nr:cell division protein FtsZ [Candidatus Nealsonbacteria bacterium]